MSGEICRTCENFLRQPPTGYVPLACKQPVYDSRTIGGHLASNDQEFFFVTKPNTIREHATLDVLFRHPNWLKEALQKPVFPAGLRVTSNETPRVTTDSFLRVVV